MDSSIEVDRSPASAVSGKQGTGSAATPRVLRTERSELPQQRAASTGNKARVSVDPLRATDRYRLVLPIDDRV